MPHAKPVTTASHPRTARAPGTPPQFNAQIPTRFPEATLTWLHNVTWPSSDTPDRLSSHVNMTMPNIVLSFGRAAAIALIAASCLLVGCAVGGSVEVRSTEANATLVPEITLVASRPLGPGQVDLFLTDLTLDQLDLATPFEELNGNIIHVHMFIRPRAGKTPIDSTATNATIRHIVLSSGAIGVYSGGGFILPKSSKKANVFRARMRNASLVLTDKTSNFHDPLGPSSMSLSVRAPTDQALAALIAARLDQTLERIAP